MYFGYSLSNSISQQKWTKVYEETLVLADKLDLADWCKFYYKGIRAYAYRKVKEQTEKDFGKEKRIWLACADYKYLSYGEYFRLERKIQTKKYDKNAGPGILGVIGDYTNISSKEFEDQTWTYSREIWGGSYLNRILAILCYMESRLKEKMFIYGDISKDNLENAISILNKHLEKPIELPARCDYSRLYNIVRTIDIPEEEKILLMENAYLGKIDLKYRIFIEKHFDKAIINTFWKNRFKDFDIKNDKFEKVLRAYLSYGFDFKDLFSYIPFKNKKEEYLKFLELIFDIENKKDSLSRTMGLSRDPKDNIVRGFSWELRCSLFGPEAEDLSTHYTFDDYVNELSKYFNNYIDIKSYLEEKIRVEDDDSFMSKLRDYCHKDHYYLFKGEDKYDIVFPQNLENYKTGDKIAPYLLDQIKVAAKKNKKRLNDKKFKEIASKETTEQIYELIDIYHHFPARDVDWYYAIDYFHSHSDALERYYPLFHMNFEYFSSTEHIARALFINDEFYEFCKGLC